MSFLINRKLEKTFSDQARVDRMEFSEFIEDNKLKVLVLYHHTRRRHRLNKDKKYQIVRIVRGICCLFYTGEVVSISLKWSSLSYLNRSIFLPLALPFHKKNNAFLWIVR